MGGEYFEINVLKWNDLIKRKDYTVKKWWAFDCDTLAHPDFFDIPGDYFKVYCWIISIANKFGSSDIRMHIKHSCKLLNISEADLDNALLYLDKKRWEIRKRPEPVRTRTKTSPRIEKEEIRLEKEEIRKDQNRLEVTRPDKELNSQIWDAYRVEYLVRYKVEPVRNAKVNANISQIARRLGPEAIPVIRFFVQHPKTFYVGKMHDVGLCLQDAEGLRTQWAKGKAITNSDLKNYESNQERADLLRSIHEGDI